MFVYGQDLFRLAWSENENTHETGRMVLLLMVKKLGKDEWEHCYDAEHDCSQWLKSVYDKIKQSN